MRNFLIGLVFLGVGVALGVWARTIQTNAERHHALYESGTRTRGQLVAPSRNGRRLDSTYIAYVFDAGGRTVTANARLIGSEDSIRLDLGHFVPVWYDPADPTVCVSGPERRTWEQDHLWAPLLRAFAALTFLLLGVAFLRAGVADRRKQPETKISSWAPGVPARDRATTRIPTSPSRR